MVCNSHRRMRRLAFRPGCLGLARLLPKSRSRHMEARCPWTCRARWAKSISSSPWIRRRRQELLRTVGARHPDTRPFWRRSRSSALIKTCAAVSRRPSRRTYPDDSALDLSSLGGLSIRSPAQCPRGSAAAFRRPDLGSGLGDLFTTQSAVDEPMLRGRRRDGRRWSCGDLQGIQERRRPAAGPRRLRHAIQLGIAYKEMGLVDEAIAEFQLAVKDESRLLESAACWGSVS